SSRKHGTGYYKETQNQESKNIMEDNFWNKRYAEPEYAYGKEPNEYFKEVIDGLKPGKILLPGEGEGRNAVYAATKGWEVTAIDLSTEGKNKADKLAKESNVKIKYIVSSFEEYSFIENEYDAIALIFIHLNPTARESMHRAIIKSLKYDGTLIIEAFSKPQINNASGGPKNVDDLYSTEELENDFSGFNLRSISVSEQQIQLAEGPYHTGIADIVRLTAMK
ncbi:MAG: methyltransferase domain-containing protein, partial [Ignavibacteriota bacterium]